MIQLSRRLHSHSRVRLSFPRTKDKGIHESVSRTVGLALYGDQPKRVENERSHTLEALGWGLKGMEYTEASIHPAGSTAGPPPLLQ